MQYCRDKSDKAFMVCSIVKEYGCASVPIEAEGVLERVPNDLKSKLQEGENSN